MERTKKSPRLRPTSSRVKKALFDIIGNRIHGKVFLDLYAGLGGVGIEALKRGARYAVFVELSRKNSELIKKRLLEHRMDKMADVLTMDVSRFLSIIQSGDIKFDIIFADPPYESSEYRMLVKLLPEFKGLSQETMIIIEHLHKMTLPERIGDFVILKRYKYGDTILSIYRRSV